MPYCHVIDDWSLTLHIDDLNKTDYLLVRYRGLHIYIVIKRSLALLKWRSWHCESLYSLNIHVTPPLPFQQYSQLTESCISLALGVFFCFDCWFNIITIHSTRDGPSFKQMFAFLKKLVC